MELYNWASLSESSIQEIGRLENKLENKNIFCIGCGPSLKDQDLSCLKSQNTILVNHAYKLLDRFTPKSLFFVASDHQRVQELHGLFWQDTWFTTPREKVRIETNYNLYCESIILNPVVHGVGEEEPSNDLSEYVSIDGSSVIFVAIQLAYWLGAKNIICLGIDMDNLGEEWFDTSNRSAYKKANYDKLTKTAFARYRKFFEDKDIKLINATPGGRVDELERIPLIDCIEI